MTGGDNDAIGVGMFEAIRTDRRWRGALAALFAFAVALRIVVPTGFMPAKTVHGIVVIVCNGMGDSQTMVVDLPRSDDADHSGHEQAEHKPCVFASASLPALSGKAQLVIAPPLLLLREFALPPPIGSAVARTHFFTPPLRGPPALF